MKKAALDFLKRLMSAPTPPGHEQAGQALVAEYMGRFADEVETDALGNVRGVLNRGAPRRIMLAGHCDEIGFLVQHIDERGFLYLSALGGINTAVLPGARILIQGRRGPVPGVFGVRPVHETRAGDKDGAAAKLEELWVDIGAADGADAERAVAVGDPAVIDAGWSELRGTRVAGRGFDDRIGAFVVADTLRLLKGQPLAVAVHAVTTVQEEVGLRGSRTAAFGIDPWAGIVVEVGFATDYPGADRRRMGRDELGGGPVLRRGPTYDARLVSGLEKAARRARIPVQSQVDARGSGNDAFSVQLTRAGVPVALVGVPTRYIHSPVETVDLRDAEDAARLIAAYLQSLTGRERRPSALQP